MTTRAEVQYLPPYRLVENAIHRNGNGSSGTVTMPEGLFQKLLRSYALECGFDSDYYLRNNPDVSRAVKQGAVADALEHFVKAGYFEGRQGVKFAVDSDWYLTRYTDVAGGVGSGLVVSAERHFHQTGYFEGRVGSEEMAQAAESWGPYLQNGIA